MRGAAGCAGFLRRRAGGPLRSGCSSRSGNSPGHWAGPIRRCCRRHLFLGDFHNQAQYFDTSQVIAGEEARGAAWGVAHSVSATILRVLVGLALGFALAVLVGIGTRYFRLFGKLVLPSVTLLAPVSPLAWLPVAIYTLRHRQRAGGLPGVRRRVLHYRPRDDQRDRQRRPDLPQRRADHGRERANLPAGDPAGDLPGLFAVLRLNLFAAWMIVLVAGPPAWAAGSGR